MTSNNFEPSSQLTGVILAGGQGRRMGGRNKGLLQVEGQPLIAFAAENLRPHVSEILVNTNTESERYQRLGYQVINDGDFAGKGPLAGILAGLSATSTPYIAICACDQLELPPNVYPELFKAAQKNPSGLAVAHDGDRLHPTCAVISQLNRQSLLDRLKQNQLRVGEWFTDMKADVVVFEGVTFYNINTPMDLITRGS
ncbi:molybdenum cofactor guanylyltransferase MobA [Porticoccaceae bacterium LTM1]|nr:molybdenum cofactor guanylyltransferase MobA [Porticoccaceae bacterium LTM1]